MLSYLSKRGNIANSKRTYSCCVTNYMYFVWFFFVFLYFNLYTFFDKNRFRGMGIPKQGIVSNTLANLAMGNSTLMLMLGDFWRGSFGLKIWL